MGRKRKLVPMPLPWNYQRLVCSAIDERLAENISAGGCRVDLSHLFSGPGLPDDTLKKLTRRYREFGWLITDVSPRFGKPMIVVRSIRFDRPARWQKRHAP